MHNEAVQASEAALRAGSCTWRSAPRRRLVYTLALVVALWVGPRPLLAADNQATGDVAGMGAALADSNVVTLAATGELALVKRAFLTDGTPVADTSTVPAGTLLEFVVYISNPTAIDVHDVNVQDVLDPAFVYQSPSLRQDASQPACAAAVCTAPEEAAVFAALAPQAVLTDAVDPDVARFDSGSSTIDVGSLAGNAVAVVPANKVWAVMFTVQVP